jgi:uncharacterized protein (TIGR03437 family)
LGLTDPAIAAGRAAAEPAPLASAVSIRLGEIELRGDHVVYAGAAPGFAGVYHVTIRLPDDAGAGDLPVSIKVGENESPPGAYLTVQPR